MASEDNISSVQILTEKLHTLESFLTSLRAVNIDDFREMIYEIEDLNIIIEEIQGISPLSTGEIDEAIA